MEVAVLGAKYTQEEDMLDKGDDDGICQGFIQGFPLGGGVQEMGVQEMRGYRGWGTGDGGTGGEGVQGVGYRRWGYRR